MTYLFPCDTYPLPMFCQFVKTDITYWTLVLRIERSYNLTQFLFCFISAGGWTSRRSTLTTLSELKESSEEIRVILFKFILDSHATECSMESFMHKYYKS